MIKRANKFVMLEAIICYKQTQFLVAGPLLELEMSPCILYVMLRNKSNILQNAVLIAFVWFPSHKLKREREENVLCNLI